MLTIYYFVIYSLYQLIALPIWWYSHGLAWMGRRLAYLEYSELKRIALLTWLKHLFVPMFHDYTVIGRLISFVLRVIFIVFKLIQLISGLTFRLLLLLTWLLAVPFFIFGLINLAS